MPRVSHQALRRSFRVLLASGNCFQTASVFDWEIALYLTT